MATINEKIQKAREAGYSDEEIAQFLGTKVATGQLTGGKKVINQASEFLNKVGLGAVPGAAATLYEAPGGIKRAISGQSMQRPVEEAQQDNPFLTGQRARSIQKMRTEGPMANIEEIAREGAGLAAYNIPAGGPLLKTALQGAGRWAGLKASQEDTTPGEIAKAGATGAVAEPGISLLLKAIPYLTKSGVVKKTNEAVAKSTAEGKGITFDKLIDETRKKVQDKLGWTKEVKKAFNSTIVEKTPASIEPGAGNFNPQQMLDWRRQIQARQGSGIFKILQQGGDIQSKVDAIIRSEVSKNIHKLAPGSVTPDKLYSLYSKGGPLISGDIPTKALKIGAAAVVGKQLPNILRNMLTGLIPQGQ